MQLSTLQTQGNSWSISFIYQKPSSLHRLYCNMPSLLHHNSRKNYKKKHYPPSPSQKIKIKKNKTTPPPLGLHYWDPGPPHIKSPTFSPSRECRNASYLLSSGTTRFSGRSEMSAEKSSWQWRAQCVGNEARPQGWKGGEILGGSSQLVSSWTLTLSGVVLQTPIFGHFWGWAK